MDSVAGVQHLLGILVCIYVCCYNHTPGLMAIFAVVMYVCVLLTNIAILQGHGQASLFSSTT